MKKCVFLLGYFAAMVCHQTAAQEFQFCVTEAVSATPIVETTNWDGLLCKDSISLAAARSEYEAASIVVRSDSDISGVTITVTDLSSEDAIIRSKNIDIKYVKTWYQSASAWKDIRQSTAPAILIPELLVNDLRLVSAEDEKNYLKTIVDSNVQYRDISNRELSERIVQPSVDSWKIVDTDHLQPLTVKRESNQQIWITIKVPESANSGIYSGFVKFKSSSGRGLLDVPLELRVHPYMLAQPILEYSIYYRGILSDNGASISAESKSEEQMFNDFENMVSHGVVNPTIYQPYKDIEGFRTVLKLRRKAGISNKSIFYLGMTTGNYNDKRDVTDRLDYFQKLKHIADEENVVDFYIYGIDEAVDDLIKGQYPIWKELKSMGARIFVAAWRGDRERLLAGKVDLLVYGASPNRQENQKFSDAGTRVFLYNRPQVGVENPAVYRENYGFSAWQSGYSGVMDYAYQDGFGFIWNDFDHPKFRDHVFAYPTANAAIDTIAWEGFREAVDDVRYLSTLMEMVNEYEQTKPLAAQRAREYLNVIANESEKPNEIRAELDKYIRALCCEVVVVSQNP